MCSLFGSSSSSIKLWLIKLKSEEQIHTPIFQLFQHHQLRLITGKRLSNMRPKISSKAMPQSTKPSKTSESWFTFIQPRTRNFSSCRQLLAKLPEMIFTQSRTLQRRTKLPRHQKPDDPQIIKLLEHCKHNRPWMHHFVSAAVGLFAACLAWPSVRCVFVRIWVICYWIRPPPERVAEDFDDFVGLLWNFEEECREKAVRLREEEEEADWIPEWFLDIAGRCGWVFESRKYEIMLSCLGIACQRVFREVLKERDAVFGRGRLYANACCNHRLEAESLPLISDIDKLFTRSNLPASNCR